MLLLVWPRTMERDDARPVRWAAGASSEMIGIKNWTAERETDLLDSVAYLMENGASYSWLLYQPAEASALQPQDEILGEVSHDILQAHEEGLASL